MAKILYVGRFELPDKEATANRVVANAKLLRELGHEVILAGWSDQVIKDENIWHKIECYNFESYEKHKAKSSYEKYRMFVDPTPELELLKKHKPDVLLAYDFPAVALKKLMKYCKKNGIKCICDVSEWYTNSNKNPLFRIVRAYDSHLRMRVLHKKADGLIVISKFLQEYYSEQNTVLVPPLVDIYDEKWNVDAVSKDDGCKLVYVGWPSKTKERLDLVVEAVEQISKETLISLDVYGIDEKKYRSIYEISDEHRLPSCVSFHGRVPHIEAVKAVKAADYSLIIRESCRKNNAGFPSKLVECVACGTAALVTPISNVSDYVGNGKNGYVININNLVEDIKTVINKKEIVVEKSTFDYRNFLEINRAFLKGLDIS